MYLNLILLQVFCIKSRVSFENYRFAVIFSVQTYKLSKKTETEMGSKPWAKELVIVHWCKFIVYILDQGPDLYGRGFTSALQIIGIGYISILRVVSLVKTYGIIISPTNGVS